MESSPSSPKSRFMLLSTLVETSASPLSLSSSSSSPFSSQISLAVTRRRRPGSTMASSSGAPRLSLHGLCGLGIILLTGLSLFATTTSAALIPSFTNCLPDDVKESPTHLQFHPLAVDAKLNYTKLPYALDITVYGNVTGLTSANPSGDDSKTRRRWVQGRMGVRDLGMGPRGHERNPVGGFDAGNLKALGDSVEDFTSGNLSRRAIEYKTTAEIVDVDPAWKNNIQTTLRSTLDVVTFRLYQGPKGFCSVARSCPMRTTYMPEGGSLSNPEFLPSFNVTTTLKESYAFTSLISTFRIISGDLDATHIGCIRVEVTPMLGKKITNAIRWTPVGILVFVAVATISAAILNPWNGTKDIFRWSSNYGMDDDMLRLVTPGFGDCLQYMQFIVLTGSLSLAYPGFFQPVLSKAAWTVLLFNSTTTPGNPLRDNLYVVDSEYGLEKMAKYVGIAKERDIWPIAMIYFWGIMAGLFVLIQLGFLVKWGFMKVKAITEEDLRAKNRPFTIGNMIRLLFNSLLNPFIAFTTFQFVLHDRTPDWYTGVAAAFFVVFILFTVFLLYKIATHKPRAALCDDLQTLLQYGPVYNTYRLESNPFFCAVQVSINILRAIAFGGVQKSGIAQLTLLVICEILLILVLNAVRPYSSKTSMNLYQTFFSAMRLLTVIFSMAFIPQLEIEDSAKGWVGYAVLLCHAIVLVFGFFLNALQTLAEIIARLMGAGNDGGTAARGGLAQVFGKRQLSRRSNRFESQHHPSHQHTDSSGAPSLFTGADGERKSTVTGTSRQNLSGSKSNSAIFKRNDQGLGTPVENTALVGLLDPASPSTQGRHQRASSTSTGFTPTSPVAASYPQMGTPPASGGAIMGLGMIGAGATDAGPYYRPPRTRTNTVGMADSPGVQHRGSWAAGDVAGQRTRTDGAPYPEDWDAPTALNTNNQNSGTGTPPPFGGLGPGSVRHQGTDSTLAGSARGNTDYAVREMDFYYGVRGPALSSAAPSRKLGTGPADPTSPLAVAKGWLVNKLGRRKEKAKGFEVVRSSRAPQMLKEMQEAAEREQAKKQQEGAVQAGAGEIGMAVTRSGDDSSSSDDEHEDAGQRREGKQPIRPTTDSEEEDEGGDNYGEGPSRTTGDETGAPLMESEGDVATALSRNFSSRSQPGVDGAPRVPRKSSKRRSAQHLQRLRQESSSSPSPITHYLRQTPEVGVTSSTSPAGAELYDPPTPTQIQLRHQQQELNRSSPQPHSISSTRLPFQTPSMHSCTSSHGHRDPDGSQHQSSPGNSRNSSNASSILPPVPGLYGTSARDGSGSLVGSGNGSIVGSEVIRPASVGTVSRHRMEDSLTEVTDQRALVAGLGSTAELVERSNSLASMDDREREVGVGGEGGVTGVGGGGGVGVEDVVRAELGSGGMEDDPDWLPEQGRRRYSFE